MALYIIGGVTMELAPLNVDQVDHDLEADFAKHPVLGSRPTYEAVGMGEERLRLSGKVFPRALGGLAELALLKDLQEAGSAVLVTRGTAKMGWYRITRLSDRHEHLDEVGVGRVIRMKIEIERDTKPSGLAAASTLTRLFGYA